MALRTWLMAMALASAPLAGHAATISFSDNFDNGADPAWSNAPGAGAWQATGGVYNAQFPDNDPATYSGLPFAFDGSSVTLEVDVNALADGGVWVNGDGTNQNGVLLVLGGDGYGPSNGGQGGTAIYWHVVQNGVFSGALQRVSGVFTPGEDYHLKVTANGNQYQAFIDGSATAATTLTDTTFTGGRVGLYDEWGPMTFDNFSVTGSVAVPEPGTWALMILGFGGAGAALRRRRTAIA